MSDSKYSALPAAGTITGSETISLAQSGQSVKCTVANLVLATGLSIVSAPVLATLSGGNNNNLAPAGWQAGSTNRLVLTPVAGSVLTGISGTNVPDGFQLLLCNPSATIALSLAHQSGSSSAGNQFVLQNGASATLPPFGAVKLVYAQSLISGTNYWVTT